VLRTANKDLRTHVSCGRSQEKHARCWYWLKCKDMLKVDIAVINLNARTCEIYGLLISGQGNQTFLWSNMKLSFCD
jgi:hypothetical protein